MQDTRGTDASGRRGGTARRLAAGRGRGRRAWLVLSSVLVVLGWAGPAAAQMCATTSMAITEVSGGGAGLVEDCNTLLGAMDTLIGTGPSAGTLNWSVGLAMSSWHGLRVSGTQPRVTGLILSLVPLTGSIPAALGLLTQLEVLNFSVNKLSGEIPTELGQLTSLQILDLRENKLSGPIPPALGNLSALTTLDLSRNELSGEIPTELGQLTSLDRLYLYSNKLSGEIPPALGNLSALTELNFDMNALTGPLPAALGLLTQLEVLTLNENQLSGEIPPALGNLSALTNLQLGYNNQLSGPIPPALGDLSALTNLQLSYNQLSGPIPPALGDLESLTFLDLSNNELSGAIPPALGGLESLKFLQLHTNQLTGPIPATWGTPTHPFAQLRRLRLNDNQLTGPIPVALGQLAALQWLYLNYNQLTGPIPATWGTPTYPFADLVLLHLHGTDWVGNWPDGVPPVLRNREGLTLWTNRRPTPPAVSDQFVPRGEMFAYTFPAFTDRDGDLLTYSVTQADGSPLPTWLTFDMDTLTFSGTPSTSITVTVTVTATDTPQDDPIEKRTALSAAVTFSITLAGGGGGGGSREKKPPSVTGPTHIQYAENATQPVAEYTATNLQTPTWRVTGPDAAAFALSPSGALRFSRPPDYEAPTDTDRDNDYAITVHAATGTTTAQLAVTITVTDVGEHDDSTGDDDDDDSTDDDDDDGAPCAPDRHGGSPAQATWLRLPATLAGAICPADDQDYFQVRVPRAGLVFVETTGRTPIGVTVWQDGVKLGQIAPSNRWQHFRLGVPVLAGPVVPVLAGPVVVAVQGTGTVLYELAVTFVTGVVENPAPASFQSGIGVISGWVCDAETVEIVLNAGPPLMAAYGTSRADTSGVCGDTDNGFGLLFNWNLLGDGEHTVMTLVDGVELDRTTMTVTTLGTEFLRDVAGTCVREHFPAPGETVRLSWQEAQQNFVITDGAAPPADRPAEPRPPSTLTGVLENPSPASFQSGIGVISGWVCDAEEVVIEIDELPLDAAYGTSRADTTERCGDMDNGFGLLFNWNLVGDGEHTVVAVVDGVELGRATVTVTTLGEEFVREAAGRCVREDFPTPGETITLSWQEAQQNFVITGVE